MYRFAQNFANCAMGSSRCGTWIQFSCRLWDLRPWDQLSDRPPPSVLQNMRQFLGDYTPSVSWPRTSHQLIELAADPRLVDADDLAPGLVVILAHGGGAFFWLGHVVQRPSNRIVAAASSAQHAKEAVSHPMHHPLTNTTGRVTVSPGTATAIGCAAVNPGNPMDALDQTLYEAKSIV